MAREDDEQMVLRSCADREHYRCGRCEWLALDTWSRIVKLVPFKPASDGFCAWARRREDGNDID